MKTHAEPLLTLIPKRRTALALLLTCSAFVAIGLWMSRTEGWVGYLCAGFFALGVLVAIVRLIPGSSCLIVGREGLTIVNLFRSSTIAWSDIDCFVVVRLTLWGLTVHQMVAFDFAPSYDRAKLVRRFASHLAGGEGALPDTYGYRADELAELLGRYLDEFGR